jgi:hypothetical protein
MIRFSDGAFSVRGNMSTNLIDVFAGSGIVHARRPVALLEDAGATHVNSYFDAGGNSDFSARDGSCADNRRRRRGQNPRTLNGLYGQWYQWIC